MEEDVPGLACLHTADFDALDEHHPANLCCISTWKMHGKLLSFHYPARFREAFTCIDLGVCMTAAPATPWTTWLQRSQSELESFVYHAGLPSSRDAQRAVANANKAAEAAAMRAARLAAAVGHPYTAPAGISLDLSDLLMVGQPTLTSGSFQSCQERSL